MEREHRTRLLNRLSRIEGQVRGIARMIDEERYCIDVLTQVQAARAALSRVETELLRNHIGHCVAAAVASGDENDQREKVGELVRLLERSAR